MQNVADFGRPLLHVLHPKPVRYRPGQILRTQRPHRACAEEDGQVRPHHYIRSLVRSTFIKQYSTREN